MHEGQPITLKPAIERMLTNNDVSLDDVTIVEHDRGPREFLADVDVDCEEFGWAQLEVNLDLDTRRLKITGRVQPRKGELYDFDVDGLGPAGAVVTFDGVVGLLQDTLEMSDALDDIRTMSMLWEAQAAQESAAAKAEIKGAGHRRIP